MSADAQRRVRLTVEADVVSEHGAALRLSYGERTASLFVDTSKPGVTVEDVAPAWEWADGDVILTSAGVVWTREGGRWRPHVGPGYVFPDSDAAASRTIRDGNGTVLRYQAGGDA